MTLFTETPALIATASELEATILFQETKPAEKALLRQSTSAAAGLDVQIGFDTTLEPGDGLVFDTGLVLLYSSTAFQFASRSGFGFRYGLRTFPGVIDRDYTGPIVGLVQRPEKWSIRTEPGLDPVLAARLQPRLDAIHLRAGDAISQLLPLNLNRGRTFYAVKTRDGRLRSPEEIVGDGRRGARGFGSSEGGDV